MKKLWTSLLPIDWGIRKSIDCRWRKDRQSINILRHWVLVLDSFVNWSDSPWGSWASDSGAFSHPPLPPPLFITLGKIPSLLVISLVESGVSIFWLCVLAGESDLCCSTLATAIFHFKQTNSTIWLLFFYSQKSLNSLRDIFHLLL